MCVCFFLLLKRVYCNVYNAVLSFAQDELKRGEKALRTADLPMESYTIYSYNASIITLNRWQEGRDRGQQTTDIIEKIYPSGCESRLLWSQCYVTLLKEEREMMMYVYASVQV